MRIIFLFLLACSVLISCDDSEGGWLPPQNDGGGWLADGTDNGPTSNDKGDQRPQSQNTGGQKANVILMREEGGVYVIPVKINGVPMDFIFDTGASYISISLTEANFLYKSGSLKDEDIVSTVDFQDAEGEISEGTIIKLRTVQLGSKTLYNVEASVVHNQRAPLLMGQSAISKFGKVTIDNANGTITLAE
jgi:aspartyl protease family protein